MVTSRTTRRNTTRRGTRWGWLLALVLGVGVGVGGGGIRAGAFHFGVVDAPALRAVSAPAIAAAWGDYDLDGRPDLALALREGGVVLFRNTWGTGGGLEAVTRLLPEAERPNAHGVAWVDCDNDGDLDLFVTSFGGARHVLYWNHRDAGFRVDTANVELTGDSLGMTSAWADVNRDGWLDVYIANGGGAAEQVGGFFLGSPSGVFRNDGAGGFVRVTTPAILEATGATVGAAWGDFDNDGWLDLIVANRSGRPYLFSNHGGELVAVRTGPLVNQETVSNGVSVADIDGNGTLDVVLANWPALVPTLYTNRFVTNGWLRVGLEGTRSNRRGIGARVRATAVVGGAVLTQTRQVGGEDGWGTMEPVAHFGLGGASSVSILEVLWPSGSVTTLRDVVVGRLLRVSETEGAGVSITPAGGLFPGPIQVTLAGSGPAGSGMRYTVDGSEPVLDSTVYAGPFEVVPPATVRARLFMDGRPASDIAQAEYLRDPGVYLEPPGLVFTNRLDVRIRTRLSGVEVRYTTDGTDPGMQSAAYLAPIRVTERTTIKARAYFNGFPVSDLVSGDYLRRYVFPGDGIPDAWRLRHFGSDFAVDPRAAVDADPDRDGSINAQESVNDTDPLDARSGFVVAIRAVPEVGFRAVPGTKYRVVRRSSAESAGVVVGEVTATSDVVRFLDTTIEEPAGFYVVEPVP